MKMLTVKPAAGKRVLRENGEWFGAEWAEVENSAYIRRRLTDGDLERQPPTAESRALIKQDKSEGNKK